MIGCCFEVEGKINYGIVEGDRVIQDSGRPLGENAVTNNIHSLEQVKLLAPSNQPCCTPRTPMEAFSDNGTLLLKRDQGDIAVL